MEKMEFIYTSGWEKFEQYCKELYRGYLNRYCQGNEKACEDEINKAYAMGMNFIREKVKENKEILKQLWVAAFIGNLARKYDLTVTVRTQSCVFILGLFNLLPYDAMKTTSINYPFSNLSLTEYEVGELFYNTAKREIEAFFHDSGQEILWLGSVEKDEIQPIGIAVLPEGKTKLDYIKNCVKLTDGSIGLIEETTSAYNETEEFIAEIYYFLPTKRTTKLDMDICEGLKIDKTENFVCSWGNMIETGFIRYLEVVGMQKELIETISKMSELKSLTLKHCCLSSLRGLRNLGNLSELFIEDMGKDPGILEIFSIPSIERLKLFVPREYEQERTDWYLRSLKVNLPMLQWLELEMPAHEFHIETLEGLELRRFGVTSKRFEL